MMLITLGLLSAMLAGSLPDTLEARVTFQTDDFTIEPVQELDYISGDNTIAIGNEGSPSLPRLPLIFVIPAGSTVGSVTGSVIGSGHELDGTYSIWPAQPVIPISWTDTIPTADPDTSIYGLDSFWPDDVCQAVEVGCVDGIEFARVDVYPVVWNPSTGKLKIREVVDIELILVEDSVCGPSEPIVMTDVHWNQLTGDLGALLVNPGDLESFAVTPVLIPEDSLDHTGLPEITDCLIVTRDAWTDAWQPLVEWNVRRGVYTEVITLEDIEAGAGTSWDLGRDWAETIRNCLRWFHENEGVRYVLIGVDSRPRGEETYVPPEPFDVPSRFCSAWYWFPSELVFQNTDWYYACLDDHLNWNTNNDPDAWGEYDPDDPSANDWMDLLPELTVGRLPAHSYEEAASCASRSVNYQHHLPIGSEPDLELIICSASATMPGFPETWRHMVHVLEDVPNSYADTLWLAEQTCDLEDWTPISVEVVLRYLQGTNGNGGGYRANFGGDGGFNWLAANDAGLGPGPGEKLYSDDLREMSAPHGWFCMAWAFNCNTGDYAFSESEETVCETWLGCDTRQDDAPLAAAYVGNVHYGLNTPDPQGSSSHRLNRWFLNALYNSQPEIGTWGIGSPFNLAKTTLAPVYTAGYPEVIPPPIQNLGDWVEPMWGLKGANLMGDPCCPVWLTDPLDLSVQHESVLRCPAYFSVRVEDASSIPIEGARVCLLLESGGTFEIYSRGFTDQSGVYSAYLDPSLGGQMLVTVTKQNCLPYEGSATLLL